MSSVFILFFFFSSRRRHTRCSRDWSSDVCSSDLFVVAPRLTLFARRLAALPHQSRAIPRVRLAVMLLTVFGRTRNRLAPVLLWRLRAPCPTAKEEEGAQETENTLAKSHTIFLRRFEARAPGRA